MPLIKLNATQGLTGTLPAVSGANLTGLSAGITEVDQWRITGSNTNESTNADITSGWERSDDASATYIGTGMTESSGIFTFPSTGKYLVLSSFYFIVSSDASATVRTSVTQNNSSYDDFAFANAGNSGNSTGSSLCVVDVTDTSNVKVKFRTTSFASNTMVYGSTDDNYSVALFMKLGTT